MMKNSVKIRELGHDWINGASVIWTNLLLHSDANPVFMSWAWISSWFETLGNTVSARILGVFEDDRLIALLPLCVKRSAATVWGKRLSLAGVGQVDAEYSDLLCLRGYETVATEAVADWLKECNDWTQCEFRDVLPTSLVRRIAELMTTHAVVDDRPGSACPRTSLTCGWQGLLPDRFERKRRYNIEREIRLAEEKARLRLVFHDTPDAILRAFPVLVSLHNERKGAQGIKSKFSRPDHLDFHARAAVKLAELQAAFVVTLESEQGIVSAAYCLRDSRNVYYFQTGMSATGTALGAGSTLLYMLIRWAANQGYEWFDFLKGNEDYKKPWETERVEQRTITVTHNDMRGRLALRMGDTHHALKCVYKHSIQSITGLRQ
jgi:CelD/BcsL family acetyltransferase involved in cellulose biosynthesis